MSASNPNRAGLHGDVLPLSVQLAAWAVGLAACVVGMLDLIAEWPPTLVGAARQAIPSAGMPASVQLIVLAIAPVVFMLPGRKRLKPVPQTLPTNVGPKDWLWCLVLGGLSFGVNAGIGVQIGDLPPAYHDEFSYLFQAKTLLSGQFSFPSHPLHPELFDQMHVLNEGRMASRYYPGTGMWLAPFVAMGHPFLGQWIAAALSTMLIFWTGREIGGHQAGFMAALGMALSPGIGLFGNTLLAHLPTMLALSFFLLGMTRWKRTRSTMDAGIAGAGLAFAMLCRPMSAAAVGLPFGLDVAIWLIRVRPPVSPDSNPIENPATPVRQRLGTVLGFGLPLMFGGAIMLGYNHSVTGEWLMSPYQLYTDLYTPRHVYGFNNVVRGEQHLGPKVIDAYDRWAENLTPALAARNVLNRWLASWLWTFDILPLLLSTVLILGVLRRLDRRWSLVICAIASLHLLHVPYWFVGIMGWHYVFESAPLWCLVLGGATSLLFADWKCRGQSGLAMWWSSLLVLSIAGIYLAPAQLWHSRLQHGLNSLEHPRHRHAELRQWVEQHVDRRPALVLLEQQQTVSSHLDLVVNEPGLNAEVLLGRYRPGQTNVAQIRRDFPNRYLYIACPERHTIQRVD